MLSSSDVYEMVSSILTSLWMMLMQVFTLMLMKGGLSLPLSKRLSTSSVPNLGPATCTYHTVSGRLLSLDVTLCIFELSQPFLNSLSILLILITINQTR
jgi:hypothetical protein